LANSNDRVLGLIDLFTEAQPVWTTEALILKQGTSRASTYRDLKALVTTGFLTPVAPVAYALGPRFIELDRQIRLADPLLKVAPPIMAAQQVISIISRSEQAEYVRSLEAVTCSAPTLRHCGLAGSYLSSEPWAAAR
jgi:DNA-binding IclR family transcriptional regulator